MAGHCRMFRRRSARECACGRCRAIDRSGARAEFFVANLRSGVRTVRLGCGQPFPRFGSASSPPQLRSTTVAIRVERARGASRPRFRSIPQRNIGSAHGRKKVSGRWGCRPLVGMGVMEVQQLEAVAWRTGCREGFPPWTYALRRKTLELIKILPDRVYRVDSPLDYFRRYEGTPRKNSRCFRP